MDELQERIRQQNIAKERENRERFLATADAKLEADLRTAASPAKPVNAASLERNLYEQEQSLQRQLAAEQRSRGPRPRQGQLESKRSAIPLMPPPSAASPPPTGRSSAPVHFSHLMIKESALPGPMAGCLNPVDGIRGEMRRAGVEPKNHLREQRQHIQNLSLQRSEQAVNEQLQVEENKRREQRIREAGVSRAQDRLVEGRPRARREAQPVTPPEAGLGRPSVAGPTAAPATQHARGQVPAYLQRRKAEWAAQAQAEADLETARAECPPGLRLVGAEEKAAIMGTLAAEKEKAEAALQALPFVVKTHATQLKKDALENRLLEIEGAIGAYSKERVLVPANS